MAQGKTKATKKEVGKKQESEGEMGLETVKKKKKEICQSAPELSLLE